ncbi:MAG: polysaccharide lyase family 7 protein, partial [Marinoscillum sp.]
GSGYYRLKCRDSGKSLYVTGGGTSNGDNVEQRAYSSSNDAFKWFFTPVGGSSGGGGGSSPSAVLGITDQTWKINSFDGSPGSNATYYDDITDVSGVTVANYNDPNYYYTDGTWTFFKCYRGLGGSSNSGNPRVELRELSNGSLANWNGSSGTHSMTWTVRVDQLPRDADGSGGVLCFGQIHGPSNNNNGVEVDDVIRVQFIGDEDQSSGGVRLKISGYITEEVQGGSLIIDDGYQLDTEYTFKLQYSGGTVKLFKNGSQIFSQAMDTSTEGNYFKVGNYLQSVQGASYTGSYGLVAVKNLSVSHN